MDNIKSAIPKVLEKKCERCGIYPVYMNYHYCMECDTLIEKEKEEKNKRENPESYMERWGFPKRFIPWEKQNLSDKLQKWISDNLSQKSLLILGETGTGKTCFSTVFAKELIKTGQEIWFINTASMLLIIQDSFDNDKVSALDIISEYSHKPHLVLDDMGSEKTTEYARQALYVIINNRYENNLPIIVTSNIVNLSEFANKIDDRIVSRLLEMCKIIMMTDNYRIERRQSQ